VIVFGKGSRHARHDDILTNFKELDGKNMLILERGRVDESRYRSCFEKVQIESLAPAFGGNLESRISNLEFSVVLGYGFKYQQYHQKYLRAVLQAYYQVPAWLPYSNNFMRQKYDF
jgi:hypothetical protein